MRKETYTITSQRELAPDIFDLCLKAPEIAAEAKAGQFVNLYCADAAKLLPRPISICEIFSGSGEIRLVYRVAGRGTAEFSRLAAGDTLQVMGPLGKGFPMEDHGKQNVLLVGGGIGIPPMLETAKRLREGGAAVTAVLGYRDLPFLHGDFAENAKTELAIEDARAAEASRADGVSVTKGTVLDAIRDKGTAADIIFACGPKPMLRALQEYAKEKRIEAWLSLEERMACGVGACLACVCDTTEKDAHSQVHNRRVCKDGPVFRATEVIL